jgi:GNAT superfamily N-acetyltransferase
VTETATRTYLEMRSPADLRTADWPVAGARVDRLVNCPPSFWRYLYSEVGRAYHWFDRLPWTNEEIAEYLADPAIELWLLSIDAVPAGYFELRREPGGSIEIAYFGLLPEFVGRGLGKALLTEAASKAWQAGADRVWMHTSSLDHRAALPNYLARGFQVFKKETYNV